MRFVQNAAAWFGGGVVGLAFASGLALAQPTYDVIDVGDLQNGIGTSTARGINNAGQVIGTAPTSTMVRGFRWEPSTGVRSLLSAIPGQTNPAAVMVSPIGIANNGVVVGEASIYSGEDYIAEHATRWSDPATAFNIGQSGTNRSMAISINALGDIAGYQNVPPGFSRPKVWLAAGGVINIPILPSELLATAQRITDDGRVLVYVNQSASPYFKAFVRQPDGTRVDIPFIAGTDRFTPSDMNNSGQVIGYAMQGSLTKPILWDEAGGTRMLPLGTMTEGAALGINEAGAIVGWVKGPGFVAQTAAVWYTPTSTPVILSQRLTAPSSGWGIIGGEGTTDINDSGWILVTALTPPKPGRFQHAAVLAPSNPCPTFSDHPDDVRIGYCTTRLFLGASATAKTTLSYSWKRNGELVIDGNYGATKVIGAATSSLRIENPTSAWTGEWICYATNACSTVASNPAQVVNCPADFTCDGQVDDADFVTFVASYNVLDCFDPAMIAGCRADINGDFVVDDSDFVQFVLAYNELVCP